MLKFKKVKITFLLQWNSYTCVFLPSSVGGSCSTFSTSSWQNPFVVDSASSLRSSSLQVCHHVCSEGAKFSAVYWVMLMTWLHKLWRGVGAHGSRSPFCFFDSPSSSSAHFFLPLCAASLMRALWFPLPCTTRGGLILCIKCVTYFKQEWIGTRLPLDTNRI